MNSWSSVLDAALAELGKFLRESEWYGRENELVNLFAHSFLAMNSAAGLYANQLGIEVSVRQLPRDGGKALVRKDLVIWNDPNQTAWRNGSAQNTPLAIVEFKVNDERKCAPDIDWLCSFTRLYPEALGYSVCGYIRQSRGITFKRIENGEIHFDSGSL